MFCEQSIFGAVGLFMTAYGTAIVAAHQAAMNFTTMVYMVPLAVFTTYGLVTQMTKGHLPTAYLLTLAAMLLTLPALTVMSGLVALFGGALYCAGELSLPMGIFFERTFEVLVAQDVIHGVLKSFVFAVIITLIGAANGFSVSAGAEGVGRATTRSVVLGCIGIILADMVFTFLTSR